MCGNSWQFDFSMCGQMTTLNFRRANGKIANGLPKDFVIVIAYLSCDTGKTATKRRTMSCPAGGHEEPLASHGRD
jgi:hypothetical protein